MFRKRTRGVARRQKRRLFAPTTKRVSFTARQANNALRKQLSTKRGVSFQK